MDLLPRYFSRGSENHRRKLISLIASGQLQSRKCETAFRRRILRNLRHKSEPEL